MIQTLPRLALHSAAPTRSSIREEVLLGLLNQPKQLPPKLFYDERGSRLFDQITGLEEYYPTRSETAILRAHVGEIAARIGPRALLVEYGSGSSVKTRILLDRMRDLAGYVPVDISQEHLLGAAARLAAAYPGLPVLPVCADYTQGFMVPMPDGPVARTVAFFPGSTIGNLHPPEAIALLRQIGRLVGRGGGLLIGVDLQKDRATLERAYDDRAGVTAAFNLNMLRRINRELRANFPLAQFRHRACYNDAHQRIEMHLVSRRAQTVLVDGVAIPFDAGESILTECSYKYTPASFAALAQVAGLAVAQLWTDPRGLFSVQYLAAPGER